MRQAHQVLHSSPALTQFAILHSKQLQLSVHLRVINVVTLFSMVMEVEHQVIMYLSPCTLT